jgi:hypothetical protein
MENDDVSSYWTILTQREGTGNGKKKHCIALCKNSLWKGLWTCCKTDHGIDETICRFCDDNSATAFTC